MKQLAVMQTHLAFQNLVVTFFFQETLKISSCKLFCQATPNVLHVVTSKILVKIGYYFN